MEEFLSLYDYLRKAAGPELGKEVNKAAQTQRVPIKYKEVSNPQYTGKVNLYPRTFLDKYFGISSANATDILYNEPDNLTV
jgi:hypothetical protein